MRACLAELHRDCQKITVKISSEDGQARTSGRSQPSGRESVRSSHDLRARSRGRVFRARKTAAALMEGTRGQGAGAGGQSTGRHSLGPGTVRRGAEPGPLKDLGLVKGGDG